MLLYNQKLLNVDNTDKNSDLINLIKENIKKPGDYDALSIAYKNDDLNEIKEFSKFINDNFKKIFILGIGGSSLGAKTLLSLKFQDKVEILENIDPFTLKYIFSNISLNDTAILTVSKSGKTIECISQTLLLLKIFEDKLGKNSISKHFFFLTENKDSPLTQLAKEFNIKTLEHHKTIGGRFSYLSNVGLIPACIGGLDIDEIRNGAKDVLEYFLNDKNNFILDSVFAQNNLYKNNVIASVVMPYIDRFQKLTEWYRQLWAESLGKNGYGTLPINALGTVDQHSQLQLYMDGPKNLFFTFIIKNYDEKLLKIEKTYNDEFNYLKDFSLDKIMDIESRSTVEVLNKRNLPIRLFEINKINERCLSQIMMQYILETILVGLINNINPFGQPAVEERKILARKMFRE